jgi:SAM-dependent methyltransferase
MNFTAVLSTIIRSQRRLSKAFDSCLPRHFRVDGHWDFRREFATAYFRPGIEVWDIGGGKFPLIDAVTKRRLNIHSVGLDISAAELAAAAPGTYDETFVADVTHFAGRGTADLIICQAVLEHVPDTEATLKAFGTILKPGGTALVFVPARNSWFAQLNLILSEKMKRELLSLLHAEFEGGQGFPAYYDRCTAPAFRQMSAACGLEVSAERLYHESGYFRVAFPVHLLWRLWVLLGFGFDRARWAETFSMALRKPAEFEGHAVARKSSPRPADICLIGSV